MIFPTLLCMVPPLTLLAAARFLPAAGSLSASGRTS
jgi:hypothetical protein